MVNYTIHLDPTSNPFLPGYRIRVDITSFDFPNYDRNHNTTADPNRDATLVVARQTVHYGRPFPARVIQPCVPNN